MYHITVTDDTGTVVATLDVTQDEVDLARHNPQAAYDVALQLIGDLA